MWRNPRCFTTWGIPGTQVAEIYQELHHLHIYSQVYILFRQKEAQSNYNKTLGWHWENVNKRSATIIYTKVLYSTGV